MCDRNVMKVSLFVSGAGNKEKTGSVVLCRGSRWFSPHAQFIVKLVMLNAHEVCLCTCIPGKASKGGVVFQRYSVKHIPIFQLNAFQDRLSQCYICISYFHHQSHYNLFSFTTTMMC
jgi:hypothetical protein